MKHIQKQRINIIFFLFLFYFPFKNWKKRKPKNRKAPNPSSASTIFLTESFYSFSPTFSVGGRRDTFPKECDEIVIVYLRAHQAIFQKCWQKYQLFQKRLAIQKNIAIKRLVKIPTQFNFTRYQLWKFTIRNRTYLEI